MLLFQCFLGTLLVHVQKNDQQVECFFWNFYSFEYSIHALTVQDHRKRFKWYSFDFSTTISAKHEKTRLPSLLFWEIGWSTGEGSRRE